MNLIQEYLSLVSGILNIDKTGDFNDIYKTHNKKVSRMISIATEIEINHPELKDEFCTLLFHENQGVRIWVAHHILEVMNCNKHQRKSALKVIRYEAKNTKTANGFAEKIWLKDWYKTHLKDVFLR